MTDDENDRMLSVQRAVHACASAPRGQWPGLVQRMAQPGYALLLGKLLRIADQVREREALAATPPETENADKE